MKKCGVLVMAYGAPDSIEDVQNFYTDIRGGVAPSLKLLRGLVTRYETIGGQSPLLDITTRQASALQTRLGKDYFKTYVGMKHWKPWIPDAIQKMIEDGIEKAIALVMAPHYSHLSIGQYMQIIDETLSQQNSCITIHKIDSWHLEPLFIQALERQVLATMNRFSPKMLSTLRILFTAHSLPERIHEWGDPYSAQLQETSRKIAEDLKIKDWKFAYQSAGRTSEAWLGPDIIELIEQSEKDGVKAILVCVIGFVADHLEVLYDIDIEAKLIAKSKGIQLERINMLNDSIGLIDALANVVTRSY